MHASGPLLWLSPPLSLVLLASAPIAEGATQAPPVRSSFSATSGQATQESMAGVAGMALRRRGFRDFSYGYTGNSTPTGEKPESKLWWNDGSWWGSLYQDSEEEYRIFRLDWPSQTWVDTGVPIDDRGSAKADVLWDAAAGKLYVASHLYSSIGKPAGSPSQWARLYRYSYGGGTYWLDPGFPVTISRGVAEALVLAKDSTGRLWATWAESSRVMINHSLGSDDSWSTPSVLPASSAAVSLSDDDVSAAVAFGGDRLGVMWSNQVTNTTYFAVHRDGDPVGTWETEEVVLPDANCSGACSDDHLNLKAHPDGRVLAVMKTEQTLPHEPLLLVAVRDRFGTWSSSVFGRVSDHHTRPILLLDEEKDRVYVFATTPETGGAIRYKSAPASTLGFAPGPGLPFIETAADPEVNNATSTKQNLTSETNLLVLASDRQTRFYLHNVLDL